MKNMKKKGFTLVELVIVIAVIAILAGVLIGTFSTVITRANQSKALQLLRTEITEIEMVHAMSGYVMQDDVVFEKDGFYFLYKEGNLTSMSNADAQEYLVVPTKLANGITSWSKTQGAVLDVTAEYSIYWKSAKNDSNASWDKWGVGVVTGAINSMTSHQITVKDENGKVVAFDEGAESGDIKYGIYDGKKSISDYGTGYFTYEVVVTTNATSDRTRVFTGIFYIE